MLSFDTETTGVDVESEYILTASLVHIQPDNAPATRVLSDKSIINPGVPIPAPTTAIHGLTDEFIQASGGDPAEELEAVCLILAAVLETHETALVGMNLVFDLTMLDRNCRRVGVRPLSDRVEIYPVIDALVLDKKVEPYRKGTGTRKLDYIAPLYNVPRPNAHDSTADALAAARVVWRIGRLYDPIGALNAHDLHRLQVAWKKDQDASLHRWLKGKGRDTTGVDGHWPIRPLRTEIVEETLW